jgi:cysteine-rich repeat protein
MTAVLLGSFGCNAVLGADEPVVETPVPAAGDTFDVPGAGGASSPPAECGNGIVELLEQCDDANDVATDGCHECEVQCGPAPEVFDDRTFHCYYFSGAAETKTWEDARGYCEGWGGALVAISDGEEFNTLQNRMSNTLWIGAKQDPGSGAVGWINGELWDTEPWGSDVVEGEGECVALNGESQTLIRLPCTDSRSFLCERAPAGATNR